ncbi:MAG TPA: hypothetical protein VEI04_12360 [Syntrophobacteria bacterium]|nr:hypothetical protein [Syntrophobacteria bacterium]
MKVNLNLSIVFITLLFFGCSLKNAKRQDSESEKAEVYFRPGTLELISSDQIDALVSLNPSARYLILGYSCTEDMARSNEEVLALAARRSDMVRKILIKKGFAPNNVCTIAYDTGPECKAVIVEMH